MEKKRLEFAEALIRRPLSDWEKRIFLYYCKLLREKPKLQLVMARRNGYSSFLAQIAMYEKNVRYWQ